MLRGVLLALGAVVLLGLTLALPARLTDADAQSGGTPAYEIDVLPGVADSDPTNTKRWSIDAAGNATMTSGWHLYNNSIDLRGSSSTAHDDIVVARFRVVKNPLVNEVSPGVGGVPRIYAEVSAIHDTDDDDHEFCRKVRVKLYDRAVLEGGRAKQIGELTYTHIDPDNNLEEGDAVPLKDGAGALQLGTIISAATDRAEGAQCDNRGDHLHQQANSNDASSSVWRNYDRADRKADDGMGFDPVGWGYGYVNENSYPYPRFCADTWIFKIYPPRPPGTAASEHGPLATPVEKCAAPDNAPANLSVSEGDGKLDLSWAAPTLVSTENEKVTGYQVRWRQTPNGSWKSWQSAATTSYTIGDLANGTTYAVQVRAVNSAAQQAVKRTGGATRTLAGAGPPATKEDVVPEAAPTVRVKPVVSISGGSSITEGGKARFTLAAKPKPSTAITVKLAVSESGSYVESTNLGTKSVELPTSGTVSYVVETANDGADEVDGSVTVTVKPGTGYGVGTPATKSVAVRDDDVPVVSIRVSGNSTLTEGGTARFTLTAVPKPAAALTVKLGVSQSGSYVSAGNLGAKSVTIPASGTATYSLPTVGDADDEPDGSVTVTVKAGTGYEVVTKPNHAATVAVKDDDPPPTYKVTVETAGDGKGTVLPKTGQYRGSQSFIATRTGSSTFGGWSGCDSVDGTKCTVNVTSARTITATFNPPPTYLVTVKKSGDGTGTVEPGSGQYRGSQTFIATPTGTSTFGGWSGCDSVTGTSCSLNVTEPTTITATFKPPQCTVVPATSKGGTVSGGGTVDCGTAVPIHASANAGYCFQHWNQLIAPGDFAQATSSVCLTRHTFNVPTNIGTRNQVFQAIFRAKRSYTLTVVGGSGSGSYLEGTSATAKAPAGKCFLGTAYIFKRWSGDDSRTSRVISVYMDRNKSVTATFSVAGTCLFAQAEEGETAPQVGDDP